MSTDHREIEHRDTCHDGIWEPNCAECQGYEAHGQTRLLEAIHDEQQLQTGTLADLRGAIDDLAEVLRPKPTTDCPECGAEEGSHRLDCNRPFAEGGPVGKGDPGTFVPPMRIHPDDQFHSAERVRAAGKRAMESIREQAAVDDFTTKVMSLGPEQGTLDGLLALAAADVPPEQMRRLASDWCAGRLATDPEPASEPEPRPDHCCGACPPDRTRDMYFKAADDLRDALDAANTPPATPVRPPAASEAETGAGGHADGERGSGGNSGPYEGDDRLVWVQIDGKAFPVPTFDEVVVKRVDLEALVQFGSLTASGPILDRLRAALDAEVGK